MCPACLTSALLTLAATSTAGGLTALLIKTLRAKREHAPQLMDLTKESTHGN